MAQFLSLGSNYSFFDAIRHLSFIGRAQHSQALKAVLAKHYHGSETLLFSQGRGALAYAIGLSSEGKKSYVVVPSLTCYVVVEAIHAAGYTPLFVDIDEKTLQYTEAGLQKAFSKYSIRAIIVQNTLGIPCDIKAVEKLAQKYGAMIIEDLAHSVGGVYADGREMGTVGDLTMLSFGRDKLLDTINGGALVIRSRHKKSMHAPRNRASKKQQLRDRLYPLLGVIGRGLFSIRLGKYWMAFIYKTRLAVRSADGGVHLDVDLPYWQAGLALRQFRRLKKTIAHRQKMYEIYRRRLAPTTPNHSSNAIRFSLLSDRRDEIIAALKKQNIFVEDVWYDPPVSPGRLYKNVNFPEADNPQAMAISAKIINLPTHGRTSIKNVEKICDIIEGMQ